MIELSALLARLPAATQVVGDSNRRIERIEIDSREVGPGALFVALRGTQRDGHAFVPAAIQAGAAAVIVEEAQALELASDTTIVHVPDSRRALSSLAAAFFGDPSQAIDVIGVTGTNGKTTATRMIASMLTEGDVPCGVIGTVGAEFGAQHWTLANTTPQPPQLHGLLAAMRDAGARAVAMEVSSHALALGRVDDVHFHTAALTNLTRDHLDFHGTFEAYAAAKRRLFGMADRAVLNVDDAHGRAWHAGVAAHVPTLTYAMRAGADIVPTGVVLTVAGSSFTVGSQPFRLNVPGDFNVENALLALGVARTLGVDDAASARGLAGFGGVPGRMEYLKVGEASVVIDYAHTPDALERVLAALRATAPHALAVVFGCGGDRDPGKRPEMGEIAARLADRIYVTSDNPRTEAPERIAAAIVAGIGDRPHVVELDRRRAIERAIGEAAPGDVVLVAGKGHETYQIVGETSHPFDDAQVARETLARERPR